MWLLDSRERGFQTRLPKECEREVALIIPFTAIVMRVTTRSCGFNPEKEMEPRMNSRVESNGRLAPIPLLPLVKPDVQISRIRLSCKHFS
jgi:hypothetical protein